MPIALASTSAAHLLPHAGSAPSPFQPTHAARAHPAGGAAPGARQLQSPRGVQTSRSLQTAEVPRGGDEEDDEGFEDDRIFNCDGSVVGGKKRKKQQGSVDGEANEAVEPVI